MDGNRDFWHADWPAPATIKAGTTLRSGGISRGGYSSLNLGQHVGDDPAAVRANRDELRHALSLPAEPVWLKQVHGHRVLDLDTAPEGGRADAAIATDARRVVAILSADCLPVLFCDQAGTCWGAAHAGWRSLAGGVLEAVIQALPAPPEQLLAWLGPAIGPARFEVGAEVRQVFVEQKTTDAIAFEPTGEPGQYWADLYALARRRLRSVGIYSIHGGGFCTFRDTERFFSYRRDGSLTGRMATLIWKGER